MEVEVNKFPTFVDVLVDSGVEVTIEKNEVLGVYLDLNLRAKSHMYLFERDGRWFVSMRYDREFEVSSIEDLVMCARRGLHGRDFVNPAWVPLLEKYF